MSWTDAAWIGSSAVALAALGVQGFGEWNSRANAKDERIDERRAFEADRRLDLAREGFLNLINVSGAFIVALKAQSGGNSPHAFSVIQAYQGFRNTMNSTGGYVDA
jgi:hypothetical protein